MQLITLSLLLLTPLAKSEHGSGLVRMTSPPTRSFRMDLSHDISHGPGTQNFVCERSSAYLDNSDRPTWEAGSFQELHVNWATTHVGFCDVMISYDFDSALEEMRWMKIANYIECGQAHLETLHLMLPEELPSGNAVVRFMAVDLSSYPEARFDVQCADIAIEGHAEADIASLHAFTMRDLDMPKHAHDGIGYPSPTSGKMTGPACAFFYDSNNCALTGPDSEYWLATDSEERRELQWALYCVVPPMSEWPDHLVPANWNPCNSGNVVTAGNACVVKCETGYLNSDPNASPAGTSSMICMGGGFDDLSAWPTCAHPNEICTLPTPTYPHHNVDITNAVNGGTNGCGSTLHYGHSCTVGCTDGYEPIDSDSTEITCNAGELTEYPICVQITDCEWADLPSPSTCTADCGVLSPETYSAASPSGAACGPAPTYQCQHGDGQCVVDSDCALGDAPVASQCTANCELLTQPILVAATGAGSCSPATYQCQHNDGQCIMDVNCVLGDLPSVDDCAADCAYMEQPILVEATGEGTCHPSGVVCSHGDGQCVEDNDCHLGQLPPPSMCTSSCGILIQPIFEVATGAGSCFQETYECQNGDGDCVLDINCELGELPNPDNCKPSCEILQQSIVIESSGNGLQCEPLNYQCQPGDGACPAIDCTLGAVPEASMCAEDCQPVTQDVLIPAQGGSCPDLQTYNCQPGDGLCPAIVTGENCELGSLPSPSECTSSCGVVYQDIVTPSWGTGTCNPAIYYCQEGDGECPVSGDCQLSLPPVADHCLEDCSDVVQDVLVPATGSGSCNPAVYHCSPGDGLCPILNIDCVLGPMPSASWCNEDCPLLTQNVLAAEQGAGSCSPDTYQCMPGDGQCAASSNDGNQNTGTLDADCVLGAPVTASDCTANCGVLLQSILVAQTGSGTCEQGFYACMPGDGLCPTINVPDVTDTEGTGVDVSDIIDVIDNTETNAEAVDCVLGMAPSAGFCDEECNVFTQTIMIPAQNGGSCEPATYECQPGDGLCPDSDNDSEQIGGGSISFNGDTIGFGDADLEPAVTCYSTNLAEASDEDCATMCFFDEASCLATGFCSCGDDSASGTVSLSLALGAVLTLLFV